MSKQKIINVDSRFRKHITDKTSDFKVDLNYPLQKITEMSLINIEIPRTWFVISKRLGNNKLRFKIEVGDGTAGNLSGFYNETFTHDDKVYKVFDCDPNLMTTHVNPVGIWNLEIPVGNYKSTHSSEIYGLYHYINTALCTKQSTGEKALFGSLIDISMSANWNDQTNKIGPAHGCTKIQCHSWKTNNGALTCQYKKQLINIVKKGIDITNNGSGTIEELTISGSSTTLSVTNASEWNASGFQSFVKRLTDKMPETYNVSFLNINPNPTEMYKHMLWLFGYRLPQELSTPKYSHKSMAIADTNIFKYFYVYLDEGYNSDEAVIGVLKDSYLSSNIFARVQCLASPFKIQTIPEPVMLPRQYPSNGININSLRIKILDPYGDVIDLNGADISLIIQVILKN